MTTKSQALPQYCKKIVKIELKKNCDVAINYIVIVIIYNYIFFFQIEFVNNFFPDLRVESKTIKIN